MAEGGSECRVRFEIPMESGPDNNMRIEHNQDGTEGRSESLKHEPPLSVRPTCIIILGMAGSGKTTFVQHLTAHLHAKKEPPYVVNLDPACKEVPYPCNIDIRDTVKYKEVMKQYSLGPNGAIVTSLNLFATKFDQVLHLIEKRSEECKHVIFDTPGQIEVFTWSASGSIITEALAAGFPTVVVYVMDTVKSVNPVTFMSNMLYACSILYKTKLPFVIAMNKVCAPKIELLKLQNMANGFGVFLFYLFAEWLSYRNGTALHNRNNEYRPQYERLKASRVDAEERHQEEQQKQFLEDHKEERALCKTQKLVSDATEMYLRLPGTEVDDDLEAEDVELGTNDVEDEDANEHESFKEFLAVRKSRQEAKAATTLKDSGGS
ncbi:unnamed protein product [Darwinula stevensoni]|uniref:GPN-loop GTPase n=1 Tax=Darwinula stevensoni TaxID=69355 RepID=A0A7R9AC94_9CRUS|nr:unnamed protein product [Darwinula stevensoni]CAG0899593.1 unnamed protein product [Darwinula stevensoni]